jgi:hypothetical protein
MNFDELVHRIVRVKPHEVKLKKPEQFYSFLNIHFWRANYYVTFTT